MSIDILYISAVPFRGVARAARALKIIDIYVVCVLKFARIRREVCSVRKVR